MRHGGEHAVGGSAGGCIGIAFRTQRILDDLGLVAIGDVERLSALGSVAVNGHRFEAQTPSLGIGVE